MWRFLGATYVQPWTWADADDYKNSRFSTIITELKVADEV
jgi:hypothetical protein